MTKTLADGLDRYSGLHLVIADALLPGLYGLRVIDTLRQQDPLLPVIVIRAIADVLERPEFVPAGLDLRSIAFLAKPFGIYGA